MRIIIFLLGLMLAGAVRAQPSDPACIVPSEPNGGFQITCELALQALAEIGAAPDGMRIERMPGGVGAVAFNTFTGSRRAEGNTLVAFSEGSLHNLAIGKYGDHGWQDVRWVASLGQDHGAVVVRGDAPWQDLGQLMAALREAPRAIAFGGSGTIEGRDWVRARQTAEHAGVDVRLVRFVSFEGGGDCVAALLGGHVQVCMSDVSQTQARMDAGADLRMLAVYAEDRLPGALAQVPTAREQGYDIVWPVMRGLYVGPDVSDADYRWWVDTFDRALASPGYAAALRARHMIPLPLTGAALTDHVAARAETIRSRGF
ncbi:Bug family tripartite tricarboxylate transporter substrate binding protein [Falsirhodobacter xinxiangensis]|uniref:Bug family tripartite tricarboxylate transporter substrate binding protein n=1 Tax=Falsirhodobacter xinxiangensis TaxID=2530049 RepID=UPI0010AAB0E1|nr:tripartite tricarboxylate transporter substrate-binding protein [Rhodobacter xinxiangensis]